MITYRFTLDGIEVPEPDGWLDFEQELLLDVQERILRYDYPISLRFFELGYETIEAKYQANYNSSLDLEVYKVVNGINGQLVAKGIIKLSNCTFNITKTPRKMVECEIDENTFQAFYFANKKANIPLTGDKSLNGDLF